MRPQPSRVRVLAATGALASTMLVAGGVALGQTPAPQDGAAAAPAPATGATAAPGPRTGADLTVDGKRLDVRAGGVATVRGTLLPRQARRVVRLERLVGGRWRRLATDTTSARGAFSLRHRTREVQSSLVRLRFPGDRTARPATKLLGRLNAFRPAVASWYGPGLYGNPLGCGGRLSQDTVGVAHKSLPCGTRVVLRKGARVVRARVVDRGPYVGGREFDLTEATKQRLGFGGVGRVWVAH